MKVVFEFSIEANGINDSFFFSHPPTKKDVLKTVKEHMNLADSGYRNWYSAILAFLRKLDIRLWNHRITETSSLCGIGSKIETKKLSGYFNFRRFTVVENEKYR